MTGTSSSRDPHGPWLGVRPICTTLQSARRVSLPVYVTGRGLDWSATGDTRDFTDIDVDAWARELFAAVDRLLSPDFAAPAAVLAAADGTDHLAPVREARQRLAAALAALLVPVFANEAVDGAEQQAAREAFERALRERLSNVWTHGTPVLHECPPLPAMVAQTARPADDRGSASAWDFSFTYRREAHPPQDVIQGKVRFNRCDAPVRDAKGDKAASPREAAAEADGEPARDAAGELLAALARFVTLYPAIEKNLTQGLAPLGESAGAPALADARGALRAVSDLIARVAASWTTFPEPASDAAAMRAGADAYAFAIRERAIEIAGAPALLVNVLGGPGPGSGAPRIDIEGHTAVLHPVPAGVGYVFYPRRDGRAEGAGTATSAGAAAGPGADALARPLDPAHAAGIAARTLVLPGLNAAELKDACASLQVVRNASLLDDPTVVSADPFIYRTDWIRFPKAVQPAADTEGQRE